MTDHWTHLFRLQRTALESMMGFTRMMTDSYLHLLQQQQAVINRAFEPRRAEDVRAKPKVVPDGAELTDRYGRRCHDIDVEKDV